MKILAIETSCDETAAAVVEDGTKIISNVVASSTEMHKKYGGVVPEIAAREQLKCIIPVINEALAPFTNGQQFNNKTIEQHIDALAVTIGPGLIGSLLIGVESVKTIAFVTGKPIIPVNHVLAHVFANLVETNEKKEIVFPAISLVVSGGHTELYLMESIRKLQWLGGTLDDAAGEAFDKTARLLGFENRGGVAIQEAAQQAESRIKNKEFRIKLPRPIMYDKTLNFSFSGLKTAIVREWAKHVANQEPRTMNHELIYAFAYEVQEAITDCLVTKTLKAAEKHKAKSILLSGGVAANTRLREKFNQQITHSSPRSSWQATNNLQFYFPPVSLCTDNAVYIASYAYFRGKPVHWEKIEALPDLSVEKTDL